jgi:hypothetical protein
MGRRVASFAACIVLVFTACSSKGTSNRAGGTGTPGAGASARPGAQASPGAASSGATAPVRRPQAGEYVYDLEGRSGTPVPKGTQITEKVSASGDAYTVDVSNNRNSNTRQFIYKWSSDRVLQTFVQSTINGVTKKCTYQPPLEALHIPIRAEKFPTQKWESKECTGQLDIEIFGQEEVEDATGRSWVTWRIETRNESGEPIETRWFSNELGRDVRILATTVISGTKTVTETVLRSYPK